MFCQSEAPLVFDSLPFFLGQFLLRELLFPALVAVVQQIQKIVGMPRRIVRKWRIPLPVNIARFPGNRDPFGSNCPLP